MKRKLRAKIIENFGTQSDFAQAIRVDESFVSRVIHGRRKLSERDRNLWCRVLKCRPELFGDHQCTQGGTK
jgi:hypothetical protein